MNFTTTWQEPYFSPVSNTRNTYIELVLVGDVVPQHPGTLHYTCRNFTVFPLNTPIKPPKFCQKSSHLPQSHTKDLEKRPSKPNFDSPVPWFPPHLPLFEGVAPQHLHSAQRQAISLEGLEVRQRRARAQRHRAGAVGLGAARRCLGIPGSLGDSDEF